MRIFFDARYIRVDFHDGISRYSAGLGAALAKRTPVVFLINDERQRASLPEGANCLLIHAPTSIKEPFTSLLLNRYRPDALFSPMQTIGTFGRRFKLILTLHDTIYYRHRTPPRNLSWPIRLGWRLFHLSYVPQRLTLNSGDVVATVSETSKREFERVRLTKRPIVVIPNAAPERADDVGKPTVSEAGPRNLIYMGSFMPYKNVETLIRGMSGLPEHTLHLLSRITPERRAEYEAIIPSGANVVFHNGVSDDEYTNLLLNNAALVTASKDEGYGLPVAEALSLGVPAVVSNLPIFREVGGEGALYFSVDNPEDFAEQIRRLDNIAERERLVTRGIAHIKSFSWARSASILHSTIETLLGKPADGE
ncbi:glycosyltransferase family 4 protein [Lysinibacter cavernae]|uniref:Glycosyltransferase involved in cell wall biosynthesis n=1 Tax=Lysinibacter cavernae TaxID=1640652 RepID=A0A7X5R2Q6_9MICO|nr:glycosyltransferase family 1 protein [Lysinibacter cavernae]NIH54588.1 glycosyltransferase involved in cell wall biosynthesis [Lysinibacter cavernae]